MAREAAECEVQMRRGGGAGLDREEALVRDELLDGVGRRAMLACHEAERDEIGCDRALVLHRDAHALERAEVLVDLGAVLRKRLDVPGGSGVVVSERDGKVGVVHAETEIYGRLVVPHVGAAWVARRRVGPEVHVGHGHVGDIVRRVLRYREAASGRRFARDDVHDCIAARLAREASPEDGRYVLVAEEGCIVELVTHLQQDEGLAVTREQCHDVLALARPADQVAVFLLGAVGPVDIDDDIRVLCCFDGGRVAVRSRVSRRPGVYGVDTGQILGGHVRRAKVGGDAGVVALHGRRRICPGANDGNGRVATLCLERQGAVVLDEHDALLGGLEGERLGVGGVDIAKCEGAVSLVVGGVEHTQSNLSRVETHQSLVNGGIVEEPLLVGGRQMSLVILTTVKVGPGDQSQCGSLLARIGVVVGQVDVLNRVAVRGDIKAVISPVPVVSQHVLQDVRVGTGRHAIYGVVGAHDGSDLGITGARLERLHVVLAQLLWVDNGIEPISLVAVPVLDVVADKVLQVCVSRYQSFFCYLLVKGHSGLLTLQVATTLR